MNLSYRKLSAAWLAIAICLASSGCSRSSAQVSRLAPVIPVVTSLVQQRTLPATFHVVGTVESTGSVTLQSRVDGQIAQVFVKDGQEVTAGQKLLQIDPALYVLQLRMAQATLARDEALLENARSKAKHGETLLAQHYLAQDDYTQLKTSMDVAAATVEQDKASLDTARLQLGYTTVTAPVAGKIGHIAQQVGNTIHVTGQTPLTTLNVLDDVDVSFALPEDQLAPVRAAISSAHASLHVTATAVGAQSPQVTGDLTFIDNAADPATGTIRLRATFDNRRRELWPGQLVDVVLDVPSTQAALVIPASAVSENVQGSYVFVIKDGSLAEQRPIKVLRTADELAIVSGVQAGEQVVVDGQSRLIPNAHVRINHKATA